MNEPVITREEALRLIDELERNPEPLPKMNRKITEKDIADFQKIAECFKVLNEINERVRKRIEAKRNNL